MRGRPDRQQGANIVNIVLLARNPTLYSHKRLVEAGEQRGHTVDIVDTLRVYMHVSARTPEIRYRGKALTGYDAVIPRIGASVTFYGLAVLRQFEVMGVYPLNESVAIGRSRDKLRSLQLLSRKGIGMPDTAFAHSSKFAADVVQMVGGAPVVVKLLEGTQGIGVVLGETEAAATSLIEAFRGLDANILIQRFVKEAGGCDLRCLVIGDKVVASMSRQAQDGEFRANIHRGGKAHGVKITREERTTAVKAAKAMGLNVCGVDMLRSHSGPQVLEINSSPGLEGIERASGVDVAGKIIEFIEQNARPGKTNTRGRG